MAEKDFANLDSGIFEHENEPAPQSKALLITILAVIFSIICFSAGFFMGEKRGLETNQGNKHQALIEKLQVQQHELTTLKKDAEKWQQQEASTSRVGELTFYNELPKQSIVPEPLNPETSNISEQKLINPSKKQKTVSDIVTDDTKDDLRTNEQKLTEIIQAQLRQSSRQFRVQVASFKQKKDAEHFTPKLAKIGISAEIQKVNLASLGEFYRVYSKSYTKQAKALQVKQLIKDKLQITGIIVEND